MNRNQRRVIWAAIVLLCIALLIPPWSAGRAEYFQGYAPLFAPKSGRVYVTLLLTEALFIVLAAVGAVVVLQDRDRGKGGAAG